MKQDEILQAAKEAGFAPNRSYTNIPVTGYATHDLSDQIKAFASIIEKRTIERCESLLMQLHEKHKLNHNHFHYASLQVAAIRKLGEQ